MEKEDCNTARQEQQEQKPEGVATPHTRSAITPSLTSLEARASIVEGTIRSIREDCPSSSTSVIGEEFVEETEASSERRSQDDSEDNNRNETAFEEATSTSVDTESNATTPSNNISAVDDLLSHLASFTHPPPFEFRIRKRDIFICHIILVVTSLITAVMNAAITIFGMGIGVGLILGDAIRGESVGTRMMASTATASNGNNDPSEDRIVMVRAATPQCRATIRRIHAPRNERPEVAVGSVLPAQ